MSEVEEIIEAFKRGMRMTDLEDCIAKIKLLNEPNVVRLIEATRGIWSRRWKEELEEHIACLRPEMLEERTAQRVLQKVLFRSRSPLEWHIPPSHRKYYWEICLALESPTNRAHSSDSSQEQPGIGRCAWCNRHLASLLDLDLKDPRLSFLEIPGNRIRIPACIACTCYQPTYVQCDTDGNVKWCEKNLPAPNLRHDDFPPLPQPLLVLGEKRSPYESMVRQWHQSQIGGCPAWAQSAEFPICCQCGEIMIFAGQVALYDVEKLGAGLFYGFLCRKCLISATCYQCT
jgi:hypothetical protein